VGSQQAGERAAEGKPSPRITLIGHSTGAVYIGNWIRRSAVT